MGASNFTKQLKSLLSDFITSEGSILDKPLGRVVRTKVDSQRIEFLRGFIDLLLNTRFLTEETKMYIKNRYITFEGIYDNMTYDGRDVNINTIKSKIWYDKNKIVSVFGEGVLIDVLEYSDIDMASYERKLAETTIKYANVRALDSIALNMAKVTLVSSIEDEEFNEFIGIISPYTKKQMKFIADNISRKSIGYATYLLSSTLLNDKQKEQKVKLLELLSD